MSRSAVSDPRRTPASWLFCPADDPAKLAKALAGGAGAVIADLEDAVAPDGKAAAREIVSRVLAQTPRSGRPLRALRINRLDDPRSEQDLALAAGAELDALVIPKASAAGLSALPAGDLPPLVPIIETPAAVQESDAIARVDGVWALLFGAVDLGQALRWEPRADGLELLHVRARLVLDSAVAQIAPPIDSVHLDIADDDGLAEQSAVARSLGLGAKACIHPRQVPIVEAAFARSPGELARARRIVAGYEAALARGDGVCEVDGAMVDRPVYERARDVLATVAGA